MEADVKKSVTADLEEEIQQILSGPKYPDKSFILEGETYQDVYDMAEGMLASFSEMDMGDVPVCLCAENKAVIAASVLASLAGGPPIVLPYALSSQVLNEVHRVTGATVAITDGVNELPSCYEPIVPKHVARRGRHVHRGKTVNLNKKLLGLYTGGSTGSPRFWSKTVQNLFAETFYLAGKYYISHQDRFVSTVSPYHIYGLLFSVLVPFVSSASVFGGICTFPQEIISGLENGLGTVFISVPMHYRVLRDHRFSPGSLRLAFSSAGVLDEDDGVYFYEQTGRGVIEIYGSTETGGIATRCRAAGETALTPFDHMAWKISDGRLCVRSDFVSPEIERAQDGFVFTSDRAMLHDEKSFLLLGRSDAVVKVGGKRVDLEEIRGKLKNVPGVRDSVVIAVPVQGGRGNAVVALVEGDIDKGEIKSYLSSVLEPYAVPRSIKVVDKIPYTPTGKYDIKAVETLFRKEFE